jgi:iron complex transport system permease protein
MNKGWLVINFKSPAISIALDRRVPKIIIILLALTLGVGAIELLQGDYPISVWDLCKTLFGFPTNNPDFAFVIYTLRLPRIVIAYLVGSGLAVSGAILQGLTRNPLADPGIVGIDAGASLAAVTLIVFLPSVPLFAIPIAAFAGASLVALLIYVLAWNKGSSPIRFILVGIGLAAIATAGTSLMLTFGEISDVSRALVWLTGSVYGRDWEYIRLILPWLIILLPLAFGLAIHLNLLNLGDDLAKGLGTKIELQRTVLLIISVALAAVSVAKAQSDRD